MIVQTFPTDNSDYWTPSSQGGRLTPDLPENKTVTTYIKSSATAKSLPLCPTLRDPIDVSLPGSPVPGIL